MKFPIQVIICGFILIGIAIFLEISGAFFLVTIIGITLNIHIVIFIIGIVAIALTVVITTVVLCYQNHKEEEEDPNWIIWPYWVYLFRSSVY